MSRDPELFPDDENGDILWSMIEEGNDLSEPREVDFAVLFADEDAAMQFALVMLRSELKVSFAEYEGSEEFAWEVQTHPYMILNYANIKSLEEHLAEVSAEFGGQIDGWGCCSDGPTEEETEE